MTCVVSMRGIHTWLRTGEEAVRAVDGVDITLNRGETFCLVGESGSGKSVTALSLIGLLPDGAVARRDGEIKLCLRGGDTLELERLSEAEMARVRGSEIAMVFQEPMSSLNPVFTIGEQIVEALQLAWPQMSDEEAREKAIDALREVRIDAPEIKVDEYPHRLSGGQRQRVMIAIALACEPSVLIADEPTTALDVTIQAGILELIKSLQVRTGMSVLFITHDFGVVAQIADRVAVMRSGQIVETGVLGDVLAAPQHQYTKELLAAVPENLAKARNVSDDRLKKTDPITTQPHLQVTALDVHFPVRSGLFRRITGTVRAVDGVDLSVERGQIMALVGESGSGKTTLGRAILRLITPTAGKVKFDGVDVGMLKGAELRRLRRKVQVVFQDPASSLNPRLSVATTLTEPMRVHAMGSSDEERLQMARDVLREVQLEEGALWRYPHEFSGGQRQRIGIARALCLHPEFIVCDEVTSALDVSVQAEVLRLLLGLRETRRLSVLFITHDIGVVEFVSDAVAVMYRGKIVECGPTARVCSAPSHPYSQKLLSAVPRMPDYTWSG
jgi:peptide/nickel transport system ATP-binding protein